MRRIINNNIKVVVILVLALSVYIFSAGKTLAEQLTLSLKDIGAEQNVELKTVKTFRDFYFTKPDNWKIAPSSKLIIAFQHSPQLIPERSSLNIAINSQIIKTIELNKGNSALTTIAVSIPPNILKDYNKLTLDVDQHYTYQCEDPFDPALWTSVLNSSKVQLDYTPLVPKTDFALFPYPIFDPLGYGITELNFVVPKLFTDSDDTLKALAMVDAKIAQQIGWDDFKVMVYTQDKINPKDNLIFVGTPQENAAISMFQNVLPFKIQGDKLIDTSGRAIDDDLGVLMMVPNPNSPGNVILVVTGNTPQAVLKAATVLTQNPTSKILKGSAVVVKQTFPSDLAELRDWSDYVHEKEARLLDVNLESVTTRGVTSVPILYNLKIMPDMSMPPRNFVQMNLVYSYAANLDPTMSKLEIVLNDISLHSVSLDNTDGENLKTLQVKIPTEDFKTYNDLKFQFHLFPVKYDLCRFTTDEHIWGTIHNTTNFSFPAQLKTVIPDMGLINDGGYPFTAYRDLQDTVFVLADDFNPIDVYAMLSTTARLAKMTTPTAAINLDAIRYKHLTNEQKSAKNFIVIGTEFRNELIKKLNAELHLIYQESFKLFKKDKLDQLTKLKDIPNQGIVEQMLSSSWNENRVIMIIYGQDDRGLLNAISLFTDDNKFKQIERGNIVAIAGETVKTINTLTKNQVKQLYGEQIQRVAALPDFWLRILKIFLMVVGVLAILKILFGAFLRGAAGQR